MKSNVVIGSVEFDKLKEEQKSEFYKFLRDRFPTRRNVYESIVSKYISESSTSHKVYVAYSMLTAEIEGVSLTPNYDFLQKVGERIDDNFSKMFVKECAEWLERVYNLKEEDYEQDYGIQEDLDLEWIEEYEVTFIAKVRSILDWLYLMRCESQFSSATDEALKEVVLDLIYEASVIIL